MSLSTTPLAIVGGAGLGLLAMYLLDPEQGEARRRRLAHISSQAKEIGHKISEHAHPQEIAAIGEHLRDQAIHHARSFARSTLGHEPRGPLAAGITLAGAGAMALGAGIMYVLDPSQGHERRQTLMKSASNAISAVGTTCRATGRFVRNQVEKLGSCNQEKGEESSQDSVVSNQ